MTTLTNTAIAALSSGQQLKDDRVPGLSVRAHATGKSFVLYYRTKGGIERRPKIGDAAVLGIADAREIARGYLAQVAAGGDPVADRAAAKADLTLDQLWARVAREYYCKPKGWHAEARRIYHKHVSPRIGKNRLGSLTVSDVGGVHRAMAADPFQANRVLSVVSKALNLAEGWELRPLGSNPCQRVTRYPEPKRRRYATAVELARLGPELDSRVRRNASGVAFLYLLLFSGARPTEIERAVPAQLQRFEREEGGRIVAFGVLRLEEAKRGPRDVYLPPQAMAVIDQLPAGRKHLAGRARMPRTLWHSVRKKIGCVDLWARDMRRTFATVAMSNGVAIGQVGELLGHQSAQTTKIYAKLMEEGAHSAAAVTATQMERLLKVDHQQGKDAIAAIENQQRGGS